MSRGRLTFRASVLPSQSHRQLHFLLPAPFRRLAVTFLLCCLAHDRSVRP